MPFLYDNILAMIFFSVVHILQSQRILREFLLALRIFVCTVFQQFAGSRSNASAGRCSRSIQFVEGITRLAQLVIHGSEALIKHLYAIHHLISSLHDFLLVFSLSHLSPCHLQHTEHHVEILTARYHHTLVVSLLPERRVMGESQLEGTLTEDIHHHEVQCVMIFVYVAAVVLVGQFLHVIAYRYDMSLQCLGTLLVSISLIVILKSLERHFGVNDDIALIGEVEDHVRNHALAVFLILDRIALLVFQRHLFLKLYTLFQLHLFQQRPQSQFTEVALRLVFAGKRLRQFVGTFAHLLRLFQILLDRGIQSFHRRCLFAVALFHSLAHLSDVFVQRIQDCGKLFLVHGRQFLGTFFQYFL